MCRCTKILLETGVGGHLINVDWQLLWVLGEIFAREERVPVLASNWRRLHWCIHYSRRMNILFEAGAKGWMSWVTHYSSTRCGQKGKMDEFVNEAAEIWRSSSIPAQCVKRQRTLLALRLKVASVDCVYIHEGIEVSCLCSPLTESCSSDSRPSLLCFENRLVETAAQNFIPLQILKSREGFFVRLYPDDRHNQNPRCHLENLASRLANKLLGHIFHSCDVYRRIISRMSIN